MTEPNLELIAEAIENFERAEAAEGAEGEAASTTTGTLTAVPRRHLPLWKELLLAGRTGAGMFVESYFIFAIGNITNIWKYLYPTCFDGINNNCDDNAVLAVPYVEIAGIITGMIGFGLLADHLGRLWGSRWTSGLMLLAGILCVVSFGTTLTGLFIMFNICIFFFSLGVGGEYPMASSSASERSEAENLGRGRTVVLTFACQGWGNFINTSIICLLLVITGTSDCSKNVMAAQNNTQTGVCSSVGLEVVWRVQYALVIPVIAWLFWLRCTRMKESEIWEKRQDKFDAMTDKELRAKRMRDAKMLFSWQWFPRLFGAAMTWFVWDVAFYGNKLFQGKIITVIVGKSTAITLQNVMTATVINSAIGLVGYYFAAFTIDQRWMGRVRMQNMGFLVSAALFLACGYAYDTLVQPGYIGLFQFLYYMSSFFAQWGANATTWLLPVELFPTDIRSQAHGICAAMGKLGALMATLIFSFGSNGSAMSAQQIFIISGYCCFAGLILTLVFVPDMTGIPLSTLDRKWSLDMSENRRTGAAEQDEENPQKEAGAASTSTETKPTDGTVAVETKPTDALATV